MCQADYTPPPSSHPLPPSVSPLSSRLSRLSALCKGTFIEHVWYVKQSLLLSLLPSRPFISTDLWSLLSSDSFGLCQERTWAFTEHPLCAKQSPSTPSPRFSLFLHCLPFLGKRTSNYGAPTVCQAINNTLFLFFSLPLSPFILTASPSLCSLSLL